MLISGSISTYMHTYEIHIVSLGTLNHLRPLDRGMTTHTPFCPSQVADTPY